MEADVSLQEEEGFPGPETACPFPQTYKNILSSKGQDPGYIAVMVATF